MSTTGSGLLKASGHATEVVDDKWTVEALKDYLRKYGGRVSSKKADLLERFEFGCNAAINNHR